MKLKRIVSIIVVTVLLMTTIVAQGKRASPHETVELTLNGKKITITYGRPYAKGRKIMGGLVPYGQVWRTGADEATKLTTEADLMIGNLMVPKGSYSLFTLPTEKGWTLIVNKVAEQWGSYDYKQSSDLGRVEMMTGKTAAAVEQFTISLAQKGAGGALKMEWEMTSAWIEFKAK